MTTLLYALGGAACLTMGVLALGGFFVVVLARAHGD